ncbi:hypothetical protein [Thauera aromatica]|uniref:hypothetical protein n=1 Tax=Thauera aromatica TaxID=59405 RepID=UPI001FFC3B3D|nr:hypothetical protein [Thauera aromatica]MCK2095662.1 hypothetical protein [Thauera aromatica]
MSAPAPVLTPALAAEILERIAGHDSKRPACAADVAALVGGDERAYWAAIEQLKREGRINCAHIKRGTDPAPWLALWPTGLPPRRDSWKELNARGHFNLQRITTSQRFPQSPATRRHIEDIIMRHETPAAAPSRRDRIAELVRGRPLAEGLPLAEIALELGVSIEGVRYLVKSLLGGQRVARGRLPGEYADRLYDPAAAIAPDHSAAADEMVDAPETPAAPLVADAIVTGLAAIADALGDMEPADDIGVDAPPPSTIAAEPVRFALWDDGTLTIYDGDDLLQYAPADVRRLALLLGVPGCGLSEACA